MPLMLFKPARTLLAGLFLLLSLALGSCTSSPPQKLYIAGSTTVLPVVSKAAERFRAQHPGVRLLVNAGGSGVGINQVGEGKIQIGMASRELTAAEIGKYPDCRFVTHLIGRDAVAPVVSSEIYESGITALSLEQIGKIYRGEIRNWRELGGPDRAILVIDKEKARGTRHVFMQAVLGHREAEAPGADLVLGSNNEEQTAIAQSDAAIGMLSNAWMTEAVRGLSVVLANGVAVAPTIENVKNGKFPITRALWLVTDGQPAGLAKAFVDFLRSPEGQKIVEEVGYVGIRG